MVDGVLRVELVYALPERYWSEQLQLPQGATVADALARTGLHRIAPGFEVDFSRLAINGRPVRLDERFADGDRLEILRPLLCDPKEVRRRRASQGAANSAARERRPRG